MELFKVICVTCQAKLSVRNEALIGQIVGCPRCGSMVEVAAPAAASTPAASANEPVEPTAPTPQPTPEFEHTEAVEAPAEPPPEPAPVPDAVAAQAAVAKYKMVVWSLAGLFIGATLLGAALITRGDADAESSSDVANLETNVNTQQPVETTPVDTTGTDEVTTQDTSLEVSSPQPEVTPTELPTTPEQAEASATVPSDPTLIARVPTASESVTSQDTTLEENPASPPEQPLRVARNFDPLDIDPANITLTSIGDQPEDLSSPIIQSQPEQPEETATIPEAVPSTTPQVRRGPVSREDESPPNAEEQLKLLIPAMKIEQMPLVNCLQLFSQLSGVPVSVAPEHLLMAASTPSRQVSLSANETSLGEMLKQVLTPLHLEYQYQGAQVVVVRRESKRIREVTYPIEDLLTDSTNQDVLAGWIMQLVAPNTWKENGGQGTLATDDNSLRITQSQQVQYQVLILLERIRQARNLPPRSRFPVRRLTGTPANQLLQAPLSRSTTFAFSQYTSLDKVFSHWQSELKRPLLIDWPALASVELWPQSTIACAITEEPWSVAFDKILDPLGLGWRATPSGSIEITSAAKLQSKLLLEVYPLKAGSTVDTTQLAKDLAAEQGTLLFDPVGNTLLALQPVAAQKALFQRLLQDQLLQPQ